MIKLPSTHPQGLSYSGCSEPGRRFGGYCWNAARRRGFIPPEFRSRLLSVLVVTCLAEREEARTSEEDDTMEARATTPEDPIIAAAAALTEKIEEWEQSSSVEAYTSQLAALGRTTNDFIHAVRAASFAFTRYPENGKWLLQSFMDDFLESALAILALAHQGIFNVGRRELRYLIEAAVKHVYVDQQMPGNTPLNDRLTYMGNAVKVARSSVTPVEKVTIRMLKDPSTLAGAVTSAFGSLSGYTHISAKQLEERVRRASRGEFSGFESAKTLEAFNRVLVQTYDIVLALLFEGIGPAFTGDLFIEVFDHEPTWRFHKTAFVSEMSRFFDYKLERAGR